MFYSLTSNMKKIAFSTSLVVGALLLAGGGCSFLKPTDMYSTPAPTKPVSSSTQTGMTPATGDFVLTAELTGTKEVKVSWTKPTDMTEGSVIRLMHSSADNPTFPVPADGRDPYWYQPGAARTELEWSSIPAGTRYFRACEFKDDKCLRHSNTVMLEVK